MSEDENYLAIARLARYNHQKRRFKISSRGDGLKLLDVPSRVKLYLPPPGEKNLTAPSTQGVDPAGKVVEVELLALDGEMIQLEWDPSRFTPEELTGCWILLPRVRFERDTSGVYIFQLLECEVREELAGETIGKVIDYLETGAHGIVTIQLKDGRECMVPVVDEHLQIWLEQKVVVVTQLEDLMV